MLQPDLRGPSDGIFLVKLPWEAVKLDDYHLKDEKELTAIVAEYIYEPGQSEWLGEVGDKLENIEVTCLRKIYLDSIYGSSTMYIFEDDNHYNQHCTSWFRNR